MHIKIFTLVLLLAFLPHSGSAQRPHLSRTEQKKLNDTLLREGSDGSPTHVNALLAQGAEIDCADEEGATVLMKAMTYEENDRLENVKTLIGLHINVNARDRSGRTALFYAFMGNGNYRPTEQMVTALLEAGANVNAVSKYGETPLKMALAMQRSGASCVQWFREPAQRQYGIAEILVKSLTTDKAALVALLKQHGARVGLAEAAYSGDAETIHKLLRSGADIHNVAVASALETAIRTGDLEVMKLLLAVGADPNAQYREGMSLLMQAVGEGRLSLVQTLVDAGADVNTRDKIGHTILYLVNGVEGLPILKLLLERGVRIEDGTILRRLAGISWASIAIGGNTFRPAHIAKSSYPLLISNYDGDPRSLGMNRTEDGEEQEAQWIKVLLEAGADANAPAADGTTALMIAVRTGQPLKTKVLLAAGADVNCQDKQGRTAMMWAFSINRPSEVVPDLRRAGAKIGLLEALLLDDFSAKRTGVSAMELPSTPHDE